MEQRNKNKDVLQSRIPLSKEYISAVLSVLRQDGICYENGLGHGAGHGLVFVLIAVVAKDAHANTLLIIRIGKRLQ